MKTEDIKKMGRAYLQVLEGKKKLDPVDQDELKGDHKDRNDKDIDNDGDVDKSDEYLHNRRKTISKKMQKDAEVVEGVDKLSNARLKYHATKDFPHGSYSKKEIDAEHKRRMKTEPNYHTVKPSMNEDAEQIDEISKEKLGNYVKRAATDQIANTALSVSNEKSPAVKKAQHRLGRRDIGIKKAVDKMMKKEETEQIDEMRALPYGYGMGKKKEKKPVKDTSIKPGSRMHSIHQHLKSHGEWKSLNDIRKTQGDGLLSKTSIEDPLKTLVARGHVEKKTEGGKNLYRVSNVKESTSWPIYDRIMEKRDEHTKGATEPQKMDDNWSGNAKKFVDMHGGLTGNETNIDGAKAAAQTAANIKNSGKVAPKRPADQTTGDKTPPK